MRKSHNIHIIMGVIITSLLLIVSVVSAQTEQEQTYVVQSGDTLQAIADRFDVSLDALLVRNALIDPNRIRRGQQLIIPANAVTLPTTHTVQAGERLSDIAIRYNTTIDALRASNNLLSNTIFVGQVLELPPIGGALTYAITYTVDIGETLRDIANRYGITWQLLAAYNNIANPNYIQAGAVITVPPPGTVIPTPQPAVVVPVAPLTYTVQLGDVPEQIAAQFGVTSASLLAYNEITNSRSLLVGDVLRIPPTGGAVVAPAPVVATGAVYVVRDGDTLYAIAAANNVNVYALAQANGILNLNAVYTGQRLVIPR